MLFDECGTGGDWRWASLVTCGTMAVQMALTFLDGLFDAVERSPLEILFLIVAAGFIYLSTVLHSRTLLAVATLAILAYTGWFTSEYFADSVGWPVALIAFGLVMIGLSAFAVRIDRDYVRVTGP